MLFSALVVDDAQVQLANAKQAALEKQEDAMAAVNTAQENVDTAQAKVDAAQKELDDANAADMANVASTSAPDMASSSPSPTVQAVSMKEKEMPLLASSLVAVRTGQAPLTAIALSDHSDLEEALQKAKEELQSAQKALKEAQEALKKVYEDTKVQVELCQDLVNNAQAQYDALTKGPEMEAYNAAQAAAKAAETAYYDLKDALDAQKESDSKSQALVGIDLADLSAQIEKQKQKVEELSGGAGNQITANVSGTVDESAKGVADVAEKAGELVDAITHIRQETENNQLISRELKEEVERFKKV